VIGGRNMDWIYLKGIPIEAQYLYRKALEYSRFERYETALRYFRQAVVIAPRYSKAFYEMGNCLANLGQYDEAIALYDRAMDIDPLIADARIKKDRILRNRELNTNGHTFMEKSSAKSLQ
jgi:tetratricopeptide (TPR) repeat protein